MNAPRCVVATALQLYSAWEDLLLLRVSCTLSYGLHVRLLLLLPRPWVLLLLRGIYSKCRSRKVRCCWLRHGRRRRRRRRRLEVLFVLQKFTMRLRLFSSPPPFSGSEAYHGYFPNQSRP